MGDQVGGGSHRQLPGWRRWENCFRKNFHCFLLDVLKLKGSQFSVIELFDVRLTRLYVWSRILDPSEVAGLKKQCEPYYGDLLAWSHVYSGLKGHIKVSGVQSDDGNIITRKYLCLDITTTVLQLMSFTNEP